MDKNEDGILTCFNEEGFSKIHVITEPVILVASPNCPAFLILYHSQSVPFCFVN